MSLTRAPWAPVACLGLTLLGTGCYEAREIPASEASLCSAGCHGQGQSPAPPPGLWTEGSKTSTGERGIGAHQRHLAGGTLASPVPCEACHLVPTAADAVGHMDSPAPAEVTFSGLAAAESTTPAWDGTTCAVYCHAPSATAGGAVPRPAWTRTDGSPSSCGACHGLPPGGTHPPATSCQPCHGQVVNAAREIVSTALHVNGKVEVEARGQCNSCHGGPDNNAPPVDTQGQSDRTARGVGAHQVHVRAGPRHDAIPCATCHVVPATVDAAGHQDPGPAEVTFGGAATAGGAQPTWDATQLSCGGTYCHAALDGAGSPSPSWNAGEKMVCGSCHGLPPTTSRTGAAHPASSLADCHTCHPATVDSNGTIVDAKRHVNGEVNFN